MGEDPIATSDNGNWKELSEAENLRISFDTARGRIEVKADGSRKLLYRLMK